MRHHARKHIVLTAAMITAVLSLAATSPAAAAALVIDGATVHPVSSAPFAGRVVVIDGLITAAGAAPAVPAGASRIDAGGLHVYPGLFDAFSQIGLVEINSVRATNDQAEMGAYNPHLLAVTAIHPASELFGVARANGITHSLVAPQSDRGGVIAGQAAVVNLDGWTVEEMALTPAVAMMISWPQIQTRRFDLATFSVKETPYNEAKEKAEKAQNELRDWLDAARHYRQAVDGASQRLETEPRLAALSACLDGRMPAIVRANEKRDIEAVLAFAKKEGLKIILAGGRDAWKLKAELAENKVPVILGLTQSLPNEEDLPYDMPFRNAGELHAAGVKIAFASGAGGGFGPGGPHGARTLPYEAASAIPFGLPAEEALRAVTLNPAEILGLGDRLGSIEPGKVANLIITDGDPLAISTQVHHVIIGGRQVDTSNKHLRLYQHHASR